MDLSLSLPLEARNRKGRLEQEDSEREGRGGERPSSFRVS